MKNWKTTLLGALVAVSLVLKDSGNPVLDLIGTCAEALGMFLLGAVAKDHNN